MFNDQPNHLLEAWDDSGRPKVSKVWHMGAVAGAHRAATYIETMVSISRARTRSAWQQDMAKSPTYHYLDCLPLPAVRHLYRYGRKHHYTRTVFRGPRVRVSQTIDRHDLLTLWGVEKVLENDSPRLEYL